MSRDKLQRLGPYDGHNKRPQKTPMRRIRWRNKRRWTNRMLRESMA